MGGLMRGSMHQGNNSSRGRYYGLVILVVAFGSALLIGGIMSLHRVKERRIFNLILKEKESHLTSLQLLLQQERRITKEAKWKLADMRTKIYTVRAQKRELDNRILEMQSTISSLKEEQRIIELALGEKQKQIKELREKHIEIDNQVPRVTALSEIIRQKEAEIEDLKRQLESAAKVRSVSTDDPSNAAAHLPVRVAETDETGGNKRSEFGGEVNKTTSNNNDEGLELHTFVTRSEYADHQTGERGREDADKVGGHNAKPFGEKSEKTRVSEQSGVEHGLANATLVGKNSDKPQSQENEKDAAKTEDDGKYKRFLRDEDEGHSNRNEMLVTRSDLPDQTSIAHTGEKQRSGKDNGDGTELEIQHNLQTGSGRINDNHGSSRKRVRKGQTFMYRNWKNKGVPESNGLETGGQRSSVTSVSQKEGKPQTFDQEEAHTSGDPNFKISYALQTGEGSNQTINEETETKHEERPADVEHNQEENNTETNHNFPRGNGLPRHDILASKEDPKQPAKNEANYSQLDEREITNDMNTSTEMSRAPWKNMPANMTILKDNIKESPKARLEVQHAGKTQIQKSWEAKSNVQNEREMQNQANGIQQLAEKVDDHKDNKVPEKTKPGEIDRDIADPEDLQETETETETETFEESRNDFEGGDEEYRDF